MLSEGFFFLELLGFGIDYYFCLEELLFDFVVRG